MNFDYSFDMVIVGSNGGGLTASLVSKGVGLDVLIIEKREFYGDSTALSGGGIWAPNNYLSQKGGVDRITVIPSLRFVFINQSFF